MGLTFLVDPWPMYAVPAVAMWVGRARTRGGVCGRLVPPAHPLLAHDQVRQMNSASVVTGRTSDLVAFMTCFLPSVVARLPREVMGTPEAPVAGVGRGYPIADKIPRVR